MDDMLNTPRQYSIEEQLGVLSDEQLEALKQEFLKQNPQTEITNRNRIKGLLGQGALRALTSGAEGALLGFQGRPISELNILQKHEQTPEEELSLFRRKKQIERTLEPREWKPQTKTEAIEFEKEKAANRKLTGNIKVIGNSLIKYDPAAGTATPIYTAPATSEIVKATSGAVFERNKTEGTLKKIIDEFGDIVEPELQTVSKEKEVTFTSGQEQLITDNMKAYNKSREEIIAALKKKGLL